MCLCYNFCVNSGAYVITPFVIYAIISAILTMAVGIAAYRRLRHDGGNYLSLLMFVMVIWSGFTALDLSATDLQTKLFWARLEYFGTAFTPLLFFLSSLEINRYLQWLKPRYILPLAIIPTITWVLALTSSYNSLLWTTYELVPGPENMRLFGHGPWFWFGAVGYGYLMSIATFLLLIRAGIRFLHPWRIQALLLFLVGIIPAMGNFIYLSNIYPVKGYDPTHALFSVSAILFALSYYRYGMLQLPALALNQLLDSINEAYLVIDGLDQLIYINYAARQLIGYEGASSLQVDSSMLPQIGKTLSLLPIYYQESFTFDLDTPSGRRHFKGKWTKLQDTNDHYSNRVLMIEDATTEQMASLLQIRKNIHQDRDDLLSGLNSNLSQMLASLQQNLANLRQNLTSGKIDDALDQIDAINKAADDASRSLRLSLFDIISRGQDPELFGQLLIDYIENFKAISGLQVTCILPPEGFDSDLDPHENSALLSILQDCLSNAASVGLASVAQIVLSIQNGQLICAYTDNAKVRHNQLSEWLQARANQSNVQIELRQEVSGTYLIVSVPLSKHSQTFVNTFNGVSVLIADQHTLFAEAFARTLADHGLTVLGAITTPSQILPMVEELSPRLLLLSSRLPLSRLQQILPELNQKHPTTQVLLLCDEVSDTLLRTSMLLDLAGLIEKDQPLAEIIAAFRQVLEGKRPVAPSIAIRLAGFAKNEVLSRPQLAAKMLASNGLSTKQIEILQLLAQGKVYKEIASNVGLSEPSIKYHVERLQILLGQSTRKSLIAYALQIGLI